MPPQLLVFGRLILRLDCRAKHAHPLLQALSLEKQNLLQLLEFMTVAEQPKLQIDDGAIGDFQQLLGLGHLFGEVTFVVPQLHNSLVSLGDSLGQLRSSVILIFQLEMEIVVLLVEQIQVFLHPIDLLHEVLHAFFVATIGREQTLHLVADNFVAFVLGQLQRYQQGLVFEFVIHQGLCWQDHLVDGTWRVPFSRFHF